jgi:hypothetical protein
MSSQFRNENREASASIDIYQTSLEDTSRSSRSYRDLKIDARIANKKTINPIFEECANYTNDNFWKIKFITASKGKFSRGFSYVDGNLRFKKKNKIVSISLPSEPENAAKSFIDFFQRNGIFSDIDYEYYNNSSNFTIDSFSDESPKIWSKINKNLKDKYISDYVSEVSKTYSLGKRDELSLKRTIYLGVRIKAFGKNNIIIDNHKIISINGLIYDPEVNSFIIDPNLWIKTKNSIKSKGHGDFEREPQRIDPGYRKKWSSIINNYQTRIDNSKKIKNSVFL